LPFFLPAFYLQPYSIDDASLIHRLNSH